jgi:molybdate transport system regulatory protein
MKPRADSPLPSKIRGLAPRFRVMSGAVIALGPGKVRLLQLVEETGSLNQAATRMKMSYMRAWTLVREMNRCFVSPVLISQRGGRQGGGARLTPLGRRIVALYLDLEKNSAAAVAPVWAKLRRCLR